MAMEALMPIRQIGSLDVSLVGLGCNNFGGRSGQAESVEVVKAAIDAGINFFDTADIYGGTRSEEILGVALGKNRADVIVATKFGMTVEPRTGGCCARPCEKRPGGQPAPPRHRLCRPLPAPPTRPGHPDRRHPGCFGRAGRSRQGPRDRLFEFLG